MEEDLKPTLCVICFNVKSNEDYTVIDESVRNALDVLPLKLLAEEANKSVICNTCCTKVFEAFRFKAVCTDTEQRIVSHLNSENGAPVDLKEVCLMGKGIEQLRSVSKEERICRLCLQITTSRSTPVKDIDFDILRMYIPEVNFNLTEEPVLCPTCVECLQKHSEFLRNCFYVQKFENVSEDGPMEGLFHIKTEEIEIKSEESSENIGSPLSANELVVCEIRCKDRLKTWLKRNLVTRQLMHKNISEMRMYKCDICSYQTKYKRCLAQHQLIHKDISDVETYKCEICSYETKYKNSLVRHQLTHKNVSEVKMYKCATCSYETKQKSHLVQHQLTHRDISDVKIYKCDTCNFESKQKGNLVVHQLMHKDISEVNMYKCDTCNYIVKRKGDLVSHQLKHKDISEVQMYKCDECSFKTKYKNYLVSHQLKHKDITEVQMYKCDICNFESKRKGSLVSHQLMHKNISEVQMYKCDMCNFECKRKNGLKRHMFTHRSISNVQL